MGSKNSNRLTVTVIDWKYLLPILKRICIVQIVFSNLALIYTEKLFFSKHRYASMIFWVVHIVLTGWKLS